jgi:hypothetical protein
MTNWTCISAHGRTNGRKVMALCGKYVDPRDLAKRAEDATCPDCKAEWKRENEHTQTADEMFG